ncbi:ABC transporter ATP-binding protein [Frigidibacter sp. ROC022]|uniref:ABC transporter ATP-binding protein n=1 Tax=Frigidibacter sp. ROC022 TaxID=2971796 RepID=UPI00215A51CB|nr:sn-glycerol-3-phosphate ABC transporter ATP-binding protein UgpC [Frigidibacter sp. ROC022]MCR8726131.1 sn-glycerol-3-phosphate ABC transporter ATP-binding protein UgpC [Frigidibacter sp. ROC022]
MATVQVRDLKKSYGAAEVIHGVSMDISHGEFVILVGPSGCGKSTLLRMIAGLEDISGGTVSIGDRVVNALSPKERNIAMVFQNYALYPQMTVAQNLGFSLEISSVPKATIRQKVADAAEILGLTSLLDRKPSQLSGGQRQRVAMGRAIVRDPDVFLFDEPLSNLDAKLRVRMRAEIKALHQRLGTTVVYVTHDQVEAMTMADRIVVLRAGSIEQVGAPLDLYDEPANMFVAGFLGSPSMNFLKGELVPGSAARMQLESGETLALAARPEGVVSDVVLGLRPQDMAIDPERGTPAKVMVVEPTGSDTHVLAMIGDTEIACVLDGRPGIAAGEMVPLSFASDKVHFFDPKTEARLTTTGLSRAGAGPA